MNQFARHFRRGFLAVAFALAGCASGSDPVQSFVTSTGLLPPTPEAKDFVKASRPDPAKLDYIPVGFEPAERKTPVRTPAEAAADDQALQKAAAQAGPGKEQPATGAKTPPKKKLPKKKLPVEQEPAPDQN